MRSSELMADLHDLSGDLIAELAERAPSEGGNSGHWPGLTIYRFTSPVGPTWEEIQSLSLCIVAQGRKAVMVADRVYEYDPFNYLVLGSHLTFQAEILEAHANKPFLSFVLQIDPAVVRRVSADMLDRHATMFRRSDPARGEHQTFVSALDSDLLGAAVRFLRATGSGSDRRVLAPIYLQEMVYRVLQREQFSRLLSVAVSEAASNPLTAALAYVRNNLSQPLTVADMAEQVSLSPSPHLEIPGRFLDAIWPHLVAAGDPCAPRCRGLVDG